LQLPEESGKIRKKGCENMDNKKEKLSVSMEYSETQTIPLALHEMHMARADRRLFQICVCWAVSLILAVFAFVFLWMQYDYEATTEYSGVYNLTDSQGNVITSDLDPDDVIRILEELNRGKGEEKQGS